MRKYLSNRIVLGALSLLAARSPRFRKLAPMIPIAAAAYGFWKQYQTRSRAADMPA